MKTKEFTIKKKREGQSYKIVDSIYAENWSQAKQEFTDNIRNDLANDDQVIYIENEEMYEDRPSNWKEQNEFKGAGYYPVNGGYWSLPLLDTDKISTYQEDVYLWTINNIRK